MKEKAMEAQLRRELAFSNFEEITKDINDLISSESRTTGNHSFGKIIQHLAITNNLAVGKLKPPSIPLPMQEMIPSIKDSVLNGPAEPGFQLPSAEMQSFFWPEEEIEPEIALENFKESVARYEADGPLPEHPIFGTATKQQVHNLLVSHASMHLSFVHPA